MFSISFLAMSAFYTAHWQTYVTGSLKFGKIDVTEAQVGIIVVHIMTALIGPALWSLRVNNICFQIKLKQQTNLLFQYKKDSFN